MATKIRLSRHGKTHSAFYHIVVADGRAPRDGRFIEKLGTYNPVANPAEIILDFDKALDWIQKGAQPSDTVRTILSLKGVMYKHHLLKGVQKKAFSESEAESKFQNWLSEKEAKIAAKRSGVDEKNRADQKAKLDAEVKVNEDRAAEIAKKKTAEIDAKVKAAQEAAAIKAAEEEAANPKAEVAEAPVEEVKAPVKTEKVPAETAKAPIEEVKAPVEEVKVPVEVPTKVVKEEAKEETKTKEEPKA